MSNTTGLNVTNFVNKGVSSLDNIGKDLQSKMLEVLQTKDGKAPDQGAIMQVQFEIGQYNAMMEAMSSMTKSLTDSMKSIAQRSG